MTEEFIAKMRRDFDEICAKGLMSVDETDWLAFQAGYIACLKRFGGRK